MKKTIYLDMDQVLTGFTQRTNELLEKAGHPEYESDAWKNFDDLDQAIWPLILNDETFWECLPFLEDGRVLWEFCKDYKPNILSALTDKDPRCHNGKHQWIYNNLEPGYVDRILLVRRSQKKNYASPDSILIDDHEKNVEEFREAGGIAFLYKNNAEEIIEQLKELL